MACNDNSIHKGATKRLMPHIIKRTAAAAVLSRLSLKPKAPTKTKGGILVTNSQFVHHVWEMYPTNNVISKGW